MKVYYDRYKVIAKLDRARCPQRAAYTVVELIVTMVIVSVLAATVGMFFVQLLNIQERDREEAYVRECISDICGAYADAMSVGTSIITGINETNKTQSIVVKYRQETGGVSMETGVVTHVSYMASLIDTSNGAAESKIFGIETNSLVSRLSRRTRGDASLMPILGDMVSCTITPLGEATMPLGDMADGKDAEYCARMAPYVDVYRRYADVALGWLEVTARFQRRDGFGRPIKDNFGNPVWINATAGRVVRLWNRE